MKLKNKQTHQARYSIYRRRLIAEWSALAEGDRDQVLIRRLMALAKDDARRRRDHISQTMSFKHDLAGPGCNVRQQYQITSLGRVFLIPPEPHLPTVASELFAV